MKYFTLGWNLSFLLRSQFLWFAIVIVICEELLVFSNISMVVFVEHIFVEPSIWYLYVLTTSRCRLNWFLCSSTNTTLIMPKSWNITHVIDMLNVFYTKYCHYDDVKILYPQLSYWKNNMFHMCMNIVSYKTKDFKNL